MSKRDVKEKLINYSLKGYFYVFVTLQRMENDNGKGLCINIFWVSLFNPLKTLKWAETKLEINAILILLQIKVHKIYHTY